MSIRPWSPRAGCGNQTGLQRAKFLPACKVPEGSRCVCNTEPRKVVQNDSERIQPSDQDFQGAPAHLRRVFRLEGVDSTMSILKASFHVMLAALAVATSASAADSPRQWIAAWSAPPDQDGPALSGKTIRQIVRPSVAGTSVRLRLSNLYGATAVTLGPVRIAKHAGESAIQSATDRAVTFDGKSTVTIAPGADALSDPVAFSLVAFEQVAISLYVVDGKVSTLHGVGMQTAYIATGQVTAAAKLETDETDTSRYFLTDVEVAARANARTVVVIGDSITDGVGSTLDRNRRWPDQLAERLQADPALAAIAVVNSGIAGNRLLNDASAPFVGPGLLNRFERDVLSKPNVRWIIVLTGSNDISASDMLDTAKDKVSAQQIIGGLQQLIARAHAKGVKVYGATLLPKAGMAKPFIHTVESQRKRDEVNAWIRSSGAFDAVVDFARLMADPARPDRLAPRYDSGDHLHPNDAGFAAMAAAIELRALRD
jgi:lysophospholipase L1-like esterase